MAQVTERMDVIAEELNFLLNESFVSSNDLVITPEGNLNAMNIKVGNVYFNHTGIVKLFYEKTGLQQLMAKAYPSASFC